MFLRKIKIKLSMNNRKLLMVASAISISMICPTNVIPQPLTKPEFNDVHIHSNKSFITKAVEKAGSAVVTIDTQRYIKKRKFPRNSQLFLDPYFEKFFGLDLSNDNQPRIEQNQKVDLYLRMDSS